MDAMRYDGPGWWMCRRCGGDGGILTRLTVAYVWPGWGARIFNEQNWGGGGYDWPGRGSLFCSDASWCVCAVVVLFVAVLVFDWPGWWAQSRGGRGGGVGINMTWGLGCVVVDVVFVAACSGR